VVCIALRTTATPVVVILGAHTATKWAIGITCGDLIQLNNCPATYSYDCAKRTTTVRYLLDDGRSGTHITTIAHGAGQLGDGLKVLDWLLTQVSLACSSYHFAEFSNLLPTFFPAIHRR
jgi:hypothetical protein